MFWFQRTFTGRIYSVQFNQNRFISFKELQKEQPKKSHQKYGRQWPTGTKPKKGKRRKEICKWQLHLNKAQYPQLAFQKTTPQTVNRLWAACFWKIRKEVVLRRFRKHADWKEAPTTEAKKEKKGNVEMKRKQKPSLLPPSLWTGNWTDEKCWLRVGGWILFLPCVLKNGFYLSLLLPISCEPPTWPMAEGQSSASRHRYKKRSCYLTTTSAHPHEPYSGLNLSRFTFWHHCHFLLNKFQC